MSTTLPDRPIVTQWLELPDGKRFLPSPGTVTRGEGSFVRHGGTAAIALGSQRKHAAA